MKSLVVYDSYFGNTKIIASAIGRALGEGSAVVRVNDVADEQRQGLDLLVVGSPTRAFRATGAIYKFIKRLPAGSLKGVKTAGFDTRADVKKINNRFLTFMAGIFGYAAEPIDSKLTKKGGTRAASPGGFIVEGEKGPLREGESDRALEWGRSMTA
jgi:flavodoxin I